MKILHRNRALTVAILLGAVVVNGRSAEEVVSVPLPGSSPKLNPSHGVRPLAFEPNVGQTDAEVKFLARGKGYQLFLTEKDAVMVLQPPTADESAKRLGVWQPSAALPALGSLPIAPEDWRSPRPDGDSTASLESSPGCPAAHVLRMRLIGANTAPTVRGNEELRGKVNYFIGNDPARWRTNVPSFGRVRLAEVYPGINLVYYGNEGQLEYDFVLDPGADPNQIAMEFEGAERIELDAPGDLIAWVDGRAVRWRKPVVYQESDGQRIEIAGAYKLNNAFFTYESQTPRRIGFKLAAYDQAKPLVIDPVLVYSTYLGGGRNDRGLLGSGGKIAADSQGNACVVESTDSLNFPVKNALQSQPAGGGDAFVAKFSPSGQLLFSTYLGGNGWDLGQGVAVETQGKIYLAGWTSSRNFPLFNPLQSTFAGLVDGFVAILSPDGAAITFSTYWGGMGDDGFNAVALDPEANIYLAGLSDDHTGSVINDFPVHNALQAQPAGSQDAVVVKLEAGGKRVIYSTFFGGSGDPGESVNAIAADTNGFAYIVGVTTSYDLPVLNAYQSSITGDITVSGFTYWDFFYARIKPDGSELVYSSYFGSYGYEGYPVLALGPHGDLWLAGNVGANSEGLATPGSFQPSIPPDSWAGIAARFNATNGVLEAATYLNHNAPRAIAVDGAGDVWVGGTGEGFPVVDPLLPGYGDDAFVAKLSSDCSRLLFSTYFGGAGSDASYGFSLCLDHEGNVLLFGDTESRTNFPLVNAFQTNLNGTADAFIAKISLSEVLKISRTGQTLSLSWPVGATNYILEATPSLPAISWMTVTNTPTVTTTERSVQLPISGVAKFFRLRQP